MFLPDSLDRIRNNTELSYSKIGAGSHVSHILNMSTFPGDADLPDADWITCYQKFLSFCESVMDQAFVAGLASHLDHIINQERFKQWFKAYVKFDDKLRAQFWHRPFVVDIYDSAYQHSMQAAKDEYLLEAASAATTAPARHARSHSRFNPTEQTNRPFLPKKTVCLRCGTAGHRFNNCDNHQPSKPGRLFQVHAKGGALCRNSDNKRVCVAFNLAKGCEITAEEHALHVCSLCGDRNHGADGCTRN
jgi:hypothetical protein